MSGPKSPYGYDPIFHDILAESYARPAEIEIESDKHPKHLRSLFNQFRASWERQAQVHHKRKEFQEEQSCRDKYHKLLAYECVLKEKGILLRARGVGNTTITVRGQAAPQVVTNLEELLFEDNFAQQQHAAEETVKRALGITSEASRAVAEPIGKPEQISNDNPPSFPSSTTPPTTEE